VPARAVIDPDSVENTAAWASAAVSRLKAGGDAARVEKELKDALLGKQVRWTFPVEAVDEGEVKLDTFSGTPDGTFKGDDPKYNGRPQRRLYFRVYLGDESDAVKVGGEVTQAQGAGLRKGSPWTLARTVTEATVTRRGEDNWMSASAYSDVIDVLEPFCVTLVVVRK
jgi:hypothetical protein